MKTLLVLAEHPALAEAVRAALDPQQYRILHRAGIDEAEPLLVHGLIQACVVDVELSGVRGAWSVEKLRRRAPQCPFIIYTGAKQGEWEEEAYLQGAAHVLVKPVRPRLLAALLDRLFAAPPAPPPFAMAAPPRSADTPKSSEIHAASPGPAHTLGVLRDFSAILTHSLNAEGMLKQFLLLLREILSINRAAIFLRQPFASFGEAPLAQESRRLRAACSVGLSTGLLQHFQLSFESGIGAHLFHLGRVLRRQSEEARNDLETQKEFELLGAQVAVPILDRETLLGVAVFDGRITGEPLVNAELELIFHLLEQLALAIKNIWLHDQLASNHEMMADILRELSSACVVVSRDLTILHANKMARRYFSQPRSSGDLEFSDLPQVIGAKIYQVLKSGAAVSSFKYEPENSPGSVYNINVVPFQRPQTGLPASALLMVDDLTQSEQLRRLELEAANLRLIKTMADRLTHEMGNAIVRLSTYQQLLAEKLSKKTIDHEFLKVMERDWADDLKRVTRLVSQMRYLNADSLASAEAFPLTPLLEDAYQEACKYLPVKGAKLSYDPSAKTIVLSGDRAALKHALVEVMLNALQANPAEPEVGVRLLSQSNGNGLGLQIEIEDNGAGFTTEGAQKAFEPFFTTRNVGLGLGLTVSRKVVGIHRGKVEILPTKSGSAGIVRISLPLEVT